MIVPGQNADEEELANIAHFIADVDPNIPWHISRFHPDYKFTSIGATPLEVLKKAHSIGKREGLRYIYIGNVLGESAETVCPNCHSVLIRRYGFSTEERRLKDSQCSYCGEPIAGVFNP